MKQKCVLVFACLNSRKYFWGETVDSLAEKMQWDCWGELQVLQPSYWQGTPSSLYLEACKTLCALFEYYNPASFCSVVSSSLYLVLLQSSFLLQAAHSLIALYVTSVTAIHFLVCYQVELYLVMMMMRWDSLRSSAPSSTVILCFTKHVIINTSIWGNMVTTSNIIYLHYTLCPEIIGTLSCD